ncbi:BPTI/Kunitz domain-containing protein [Hymenobacter sp. GOD-10R]|uniref:BPTI/Kunitz domain-containing protein n=1 Tax=Hymenobacter sp. GOD-10R TaxID=3093922 RepID=UPI002D784BDD|nr:BPTI/Kunitz domain-containing protein [Hymenobacter sp. GOD-10R]WRQ30063.1 BPTI/Kunitz domain-containing protein [Hymenobacter sp. GOD-10R]
MKRYSTPLYAAGLAIMLLLTNCQKESEAAVPEQCQLTPDPGPCNAAFVRYYYDPKEQKCMPFTWGGCGGTVPFNTLQECKDCAGK